MHLFRQIIHRIGSVLLAFVLLWIVAGTLIEFHQRHVFQVEVDFWQVVVQQPGKDLKKVYYIFDKNGNQANGFDLMKIGHSMDHDLLYLTLSQRSTFSRIYCDPLTAEYSSERILRGPPTV